MGRERRDSAGCFLVARSEKAETWTKGLHMIAVRNFDVSASMLGVCVSLLHALRRRGVEQTGEGRCSYCSSGAKAGTNAVFLPKLFF